MGGSGPAAPQQQQRRGGELRVTGCDVARSVVSPHAAKGGRGARERAAVGWRLPKLEELTKTGAKQERGGGVRGQLCSAECQTEPGLSN